MNDGVEQTPDEVRVLRPRQDESRDCGRGDHHERVFGRALPGLRMISASQQRQQGVGQQLQQRTTSQVDERTRGVREWIEGKAGGSASDTGDDRRDNREQRKGGQYAAHEREAEPDGHGSDPGFGTTTEIGAHRGCEPGQCGRGRRSEARARAQCVGQAARPGRSPAHLS